MTTSPAASRDNAAAAPSPTSYAIPDTDEVLQDTEHHLTQATVQAIIDRARSDAADIRRDAIEAAQRIVAEARLRANTLERNADFSVSERFRTARAGQLPAPEVTTKRTNLDDERSAAAAVLESFSPTETEQSPGQPSAQDQPNARRPSKSFAHLWNTQVDEVDIEAFLAVELDRREVRGFLKH